MDLMAIILVIKCQEAVLMNWQIVSRKTVVINYKKNAVK